MKKLLVVIDPTVTECPVLDRAAWLARKLGASIELLICEYDQFVASDQRAIESLIAHHVDRLEKLAQPLRDEGIEVAVDAIWDRPLDEGIVRKVLHASPDLVLKDTHYHAAIRRALFSNTDWNLIRKCPAPLLLVKPVAVSVPLRVVAAVDPFHVNDEPAALDHRIVETAKGLSAALNAELRVVHCFNDQILSAITIPNLATPASPPLFDKEAIDELENQHRKAVEDLLKEHSLGADLVEIGRGVPQDVLPEMAARLGAEILVTGAVSRGAIGRLLVGSTAERVLDRLPCDLLVVKAPSFETQLDTDRASS